MLLIYDERFSWLCRYYEDEQLAILVCFELILLSATGLLAIWGSLGRPHWLVRAAVVLAGLSLWLVVPAYEPMLVFFTQTAVAALVVSLARYRRATQPPHLPQFSLRDMLLWTVVVAVLSAAAAQVTRDVWHGWWKYLLHGTAYGLLTVAAAWVALGRCRWWIRAIGGCLGFLSLLMVGWLLLGRWSGACGAAPSARPMFRHAARVGIVALSLLILLPSAFLYYRLAAPTPIPVAELPESNGYDDLMQAGEMVASVTQPERADGVDALRAFVQKHAPTLRMARKGLDRECLVPVQYDTEDFSGNVGSIQNIRALARTFLVEAFLAEEEGRAEDAMRIHCDNFRLGKAAARGGSLIDRLVGLAVDGIGIEALNDLSDRLSPSQCRKLIEILETSESGWESVEECLTREKAWGDHAFGWRGRVWYMAYLLSEESKMAAEQRQDRDFRNEARKRLLIGKLAIRCYRLERGELPVTLADLVPEYLAAVPEDPFSGKALIYRRSEEADVLYSVGDDGVDDGGHRVDPHAESAGDKDLFLNTPAHD